MWVTIEGMAKLRKLDTFGGRLRMAREDAGLNQEQLTALLAERYGVTIGRSYISELERSWEANKMPMADVLAAIASALNVNGNWLLLLDDNPDLPEPDAGHGVSVEAQEIANLVDALPPWRRRELLVWLHYVLDVGEELQSETRQTAEEIRLRLAAAGLVLGPETMRTIEMALLRFVAGAPGDGRAGDLSGPDAGVRQPPARRRRNNKTASNIGGNAGVMDSDRYRAQVERLRTAIAAEHSAQTQLQAAALAAAQRGSRRDRLQEIATHGPAMLATPDTAAANTWLRQYVRVFVAKNRVIEVRFL